MNVINTKLLVDRIQQADWFGSIGSLNELLGVVRAPDWPTAIGYSSTDEWDDVLTQAANDQAAFIARACGGWRFIREWNKFANTLRPEMRSLVEKKIALNIQSAAMPKVAVASLRWILLHGCLGAAFLDWPNKEPFFSTATQFVIDGYFPCGWHGEYPQGKMIVY